MFDLPGLGMEPLSPASAGEFFTTELHGNPKEANSSCTSDTLNQSLQG